MATINVLDADNVAVAIEKPLAPGRSAAATSRPVALSTEDKTALDAVATQTTVAAILAKLSADPATQTTLAAVLAKIIAAPATEAKQDAAITQGTAINTVLGTTSGAAVTTSVAGTIQGYLRGIVSLLVSGVTVAAHAVTQSGTWTVQPGNTANTTAWKVDGSAATQPASIADNSHVTFGAKADAKSTATDTTSISAMSVWKQISASVQAIATSAASLVTGTVLAAGTALIGRAVADASAATGGIASTARMASAAATTNATNVKTSAGRIYSVCGINKAAYDVFLVLYDSASNPPVPGTTTIRKKIPCPAGQAFVYDFPLGLSCANGIGYAFTKLVADADTTALASADVTAFNMDYV